MAQVTKPKQAASARELDRWQLIVQAALTHLECEEYLLTKEGLEALLASMRKAERR